MAEWIPQYVSENGLFTGSVLKGSMQRFLDASSAITGGLQSRFELLEQNTSDWYWTGAYGTKGQKIIELAKTDTANNTILFEIEVKKPEGATYWKQTIVFYISYYSDYTQGANYDQWHDHISLGGISRYEYATPYSMPTATSIITANPGIDPWWNEGDLTAVPAQWDLQLSRFMLGIGNGYVNDEEYFGVYLYDEQYRLTVANKQRAQYASLAVPMSTLKQLFGGDFEPEEEEDPTEDPINPDNPPGPTDPSDPGGGGDHDRNEDPIPEPDLPVIGAAGAGFVTMYRMTQGEIQIFARDLFTDPFDPNKAWQNIKNFFSDPLDFMIGCMIVPFTPASTHAEYPEFGLFTWPDPYDVIDNQFHIIDCGAHYIPNYYNTALDYNPLTKITVWLPFIGYRDLDADEVMGRTIKIKYHVDCLTGDCVAFIIKVRPLYEQVIAQYSGNCALRVPYGRQSFDAAVQAGIQLLGGAAGAAVGAAQIMSEGGGPEGSESLSGVAKSFTVGAINSMKVHTERAGVAGASAGYMGVMKPYVIRHIPDQSLPDNYKRIVGYPSNVGGRLSQFSGFTAVENIELSGVMATDEEKHEIISILRGGFII